MLVPGGNPLSPNSSKTAWNFQTPFYRMDTDSLRMVYVNFHRPISHRDFFMTVFFISMPKVQLATGAHFSSPKYRHLKYVFSCNFFYFLTKFNIL